MNRVVLIITFVIGVFGLPDGTEFIDWNTLENQQSLSDYQEPAQYILYNRKYPNGTKDFSHLNKRRPTYFLIHGYTDTPQKSIMLPLLTEAYLFKEKCNVVVVDWGALAAGPIYRRAAEKTITVGQALAQFIDSHMNTTSVTLVGFSLGAHVAGFAASKTKGRISRIIGLDPAQVLFADSPPEFKLDTSDAEIVEVLHTSGGLYGFRQSIGHRDFYPNGGTPPQPGCGLDITGSCSHRRAYYYYNEALRDPHGGFRARKCPNYEDFTNHKCKVNGKPIILELVNDNTDKSLSGNFYFVTNPQEPFIKFKINK